MIFKNEKAHVKKLNSFQHFGNILTDSESPAFKFVRIGLTYAFIFTEKFKINKTSNLFDDFFTPKTVF